MREQNVANDGTDGWECKEGGCGWRWNEDRWWVGLIGLGEDVCRLGCGDNGMVRGRLANAQHSVTRRLKSSKSSDLRGAERERGPNSAAGERGEAEKKDRVNAQQL